MHKAEKHLPDDFNEDNIYVECGHCGGEVKITEAYTTKKEIDVSSITGELRDDGVHMWHTEDQKTFYCSKEHGTLQEL